MDIEVVHPVVDTILGRYKRELGEQRSAYRNHVFRSFHYHKLLFGKELPDSAVLAWAVHDLGIWTAKTVDYLEPSATLGEELSGEFGVDDIKTMRQLVVDHHRLRPVPDRLTETFRLADRIDVYRGLAPIRSGVSRAEVRAVEHQFPYLGFQSFLVKRLTAYAVLHPRRPMPMVRW